MATGVWRRTWRPSPVLVIEERVDAGRVLYARWWAPGEGGRGRWRRRSSGLRLRAHASGAVDPAVEREALALGERMHRALLEGREPELGLSGRRSLAHVLDAYLRGETPGLSPRHRQDLVRAARAVTDVLGGATPWSSLTPASGRALWRALAERSRDGRGESWAIRVVELLWRVAAWAAMDEELGRGAALAAPAGWRRSLRADWARIARRGREAPPPRRPRYTEEEAERLWAHLADAAPQLELLVELAAPALRLGQASGVMRSALDLRLGRGVHGLGVVHLPGARGKRGASVALDGEARRAVERALATWLVERERAYRVGEIGDYALIPGKLVAGRAPLGPDVGRPLARTTLRTLYAAWERAAGVEHRGLHAWRRLAADMSAEETQDPTVRDHVGAWVPGSGVRERVYRDGEDARAREAAERVRARIRARLRGACVSPAHAHVAPGTRVI